MLEGKDCTGHRRQPWHWQGDCRALGEQGATVIGTPPPRWSRGDHAALCGAGIKGQGMRLDVGDESLSMR